MDIDKPSPLSHIVCVQTQPLAARETLTTAGQACKYVTSKCPPLLSSSCFIPLGRLFLAASDLGTDWGRCSLVQDVAWPPPFRPPDPCTALRCYAAACPPATGGGGDGLLSSWTRCQSGRPCRIKSANTTLAASQGPSPPCPALNSWGLFCPSPQCNVLAIHDRWLIRYKETNNGRTRETRASPLPLRLPKTLAPQMRNQAIKRRIVSIRTPRLERRGTQ